MDRDDVQRVIQTFRPKLKEQLQPDTLEFLKAHKIFNDDEYEEISKYEREEQIVRILDILPWKEKSAVVSFLDYIQKWYSWIFNSANITDDEDLKEAHRILAEGEVPPLPSRHVFRRSEFITLLDLLNQLQQNEYVVVLGMGGCGKSTLVSETLYKSKSLVLDVFKRKVYWYTIGREATTEPLTVLQELYGKLFFMSRGYKPPALLQDIKTAKFALTSKLNEEEFQDCLLILDDVPSSAFISSLNIGCKILVTTDNKEIMHGINNKIHYLTVSAGFTEAESLELFSSSLETNALPDQAKHIHSLCKGFPITISLLASQLSEHREDVLHNLDRWNVYIRELKKKDLHGAIGEYDNYRLPRVKSLYNALGMSINSLPPKLKKYYQDFAIFMDDVNIKPEVLCTLWGLHKKDVEDIMSIFAKKCLVIKIFNQHLNCYIYCIHDLLLQYLKQGLSSSEKQALHRKLIDSYKAKDTDYMKFSHDDNYIFLYLGYHLYEAGYIHEFPRLYLDLRFLEAKIMKHGPADVLYDFKKYKQYIQGSGLTKSKENYKVTEQLAVKPGINFFEYLFWKIAIFLRLIFSSPLQLFKSDGDTKTETNIKKYEDLQHFIRRIGICRKLSNSDIIQFGLSESKESCVYKMAKDLAVKSGNKYFEFLTEVPEENTPPFVYCRENITTAIFTSSDDYLLVANDKNEIKYIHIKNHLKVYTLATFKGHKEKITQLQLNSKILSYFLSASEDSTVRIWYLNNLANVGQMYEKPRTPSPQLQQDYWQDAFPKQRHTGEGAAVILNKHTRPIKHAQFSNGGLMVATAGADCKIIIWKFLEEKDHQDVKLKNCGKLNVNTKDVIECVSFSNDDKVLLAASKSGTISVYDTQTGEFNMCVPREHPIKSIIVLPNMQEIEVLVLADNYFYVMGIPKDKDGEIRLPETWKRKTLKKKREDKYICAAISKEGHHVALASTNYTIRVKEVYTEKEVQRFIETNGKIQCLNWSFTGTSLVAAYANTIAKVWSVRNVNSMKEVGKYLLFDATWIPYQDEDNVSKNEGYMLTAALNNKNHIEVYSDLQLCSTIEIPKSKDVSKVCVCSSDGHVVYATKQGCVYLAIFDKWVPQEIVNLKCLDVSKLKVYTRKNTTFIVIQVQTEPTGKQSLVGCVLNNYNFSEVSQIHYKIKSDVISDFSVQLEKGSLYVVDENHILYVYNYKDESLKAEIKIKTDELDESKFCDFSPNYTYVAVGSSKAVHLRAINQTRSYTWNFEKTLTATSCKFSYDEKYLAVGFKEGNVHIYNTELGGLIKLRDSSSEIIDMVWSPCDYRILLILDREIVLYGEIFDKSVISTLYLNVDKVLTNFAFNRFTTVDNSGYLHVLKC